MESEAREGACAPPPIGGDPGDMPAAAALFEIAAAHGGHGSVAEISAASGLDPQRVAAGWRTLRELALVEVTGGRVEAVDPETALRTLVCSYTSHANAQLRSVQEANETTHQLLNVFGPSASGPDGPSGPEALGTATGTATATAAAVGADDDGTDEPDGPESRQVLVQEYRGPGSRERALQGIVGAVRESVDVLVPGRLSSDRVTLDANLQLGAAMAARGIRMRALYSAEVLRDPDCDRFLRQVAEVGVEIRVIDRIVRTFNDVMIFDRDTVFLSGYPGRALANGEPGPDEPVIRIGGSVLAPSFLAMFEAYWVRASPYVTPSQGRLPSGGPQLSPFEETVVRLMSYGYDDGWIARELGVDTGAVADVMQTLMQRLGAASRFEAGFRLSAGLDRTQLP
ncbi:hypothetical protein [Streptomyces sp. NPDC020917]|uniref:hypothetical protein n=1 Tax=Streptomyces sp. NPDC020917 TaxID=3365102 RepID=UPI0037A911C4